MTNCQIRMLIKHNDYWSLFFKLLLTSEKNCAIMQIMTVSHFAKNVLTNWRNSVIIKVVVILCS